MQDTFSLFIDDFTHLDGAIWHPLRGPIGISYQLGIEFTGNVQKDGTVFDFSAAKKCAKKVIDSTADHAFSVPRNLIEYKVENNYIKFSSMGLEYTAPNQAFYVIDTVSEMGLFQSLEKLIFEECKKRSDCSVLQAVKLTYTLENNADNVVYFNYIHGLKENTSNCQRLIHGHRSTIKVWINEERSPIHEKYLANLYHDKHLAIQENIVNHTNDFITVEYDGNQGHFHGTFDARKVLIMPYETTIENISKFSTETLKNDFELKKAVVTVAAYEGIGKGSKYTLDQSYKTQKLEQVLTEGLI